MGIFTDNLNFDLLSLTVSAIAVLIVYFKWKITYWDRVGLPTLNPVMLYGDSKKMILGKLSMGQQFQEFYEKFKAKNVKHGGVYMGMKPFYLPIDPKIIKHIMQVDFEHFVNHGFFVNEEADPLSGTLFALEDAKWRNMRVKLTPTFTSGKLKMMFETLANCTIGLKSILDESIAKKEPIDIKEVLARFTTDIIGSVAFGLECNSLKDPDAEFRKYGRKVFEVNSWDRIKNMAFVLMPKFFLKAIKIKFTKPDVERFFMQIVQDTVHYREKNNIYRKDFMHLLLQLKNRGVVSDDDKITDEQGNTQEKGLTMNELAAQAFIFFVAGYETSSTTTSFALLELALNPHIQDKLREEINTVLAKYNDQLTYSGMMDMIYMEKVLNETLRKHPPASVLFRQCNKDYIVPNTSIQIKKGTDVAIATLGLHHDPEYYPNPEIFDPERFSEENKKSRPSFTWLPFGEGPRICIGLRLGMLQSKVGLTAILKNYKISLNKKTKLPITIDKKSLVTTVEGGIWLDVEKIN